MTYLGWDIATSSLFGSLTIGFGSLWLGKKVFCPMTVLYIPALLPMVPGKFAYNMIFSLIMFLQTMDDPQEYVLLKYDRNDNSHLIIGSRGNFAALHILETSFFFNPT